MEFVLLFFATIGFFVYAPIVHVPLFLLHTIALLWIAWRRLPSQPLTALFVVAYIGMYFPNPVAIMLDWVPLESGITDAILYRSNILILVGIDLFLLAALRLRFTPFDTNRMEPHQLDSGRVEMCSVLLLFIAGTVTIALIALLIVMGVNPFTVAKTYRSIGGAQSIYYLIAKYIFFVVPLVVFLVGLRRFFSQMLYFLPVLCLLAIHFMIYRTRTLMVACMISWLIAIVVRDRLVMVGPVMVTRRVSFVLRAFVFIAVPLLALTGVSLKYIRLSHSLQDYSLQQDRITYLVGSTFAGGDLGYSLFLRSAMTYFPGSKPYLLGQSYYRLLFVPIPRWAWPGKPENTQRVFARVLDPELGDTGTTIPAGIIGDLYINFGYVGVFGMLVFGYFFGRERYCHFTDILFLAGSGSWMFHFVRGAFTNPIVTMMLIWLLCYMLNRMISPTRISHSDATIESALPTGRAANVLRKPREAIY